MANRAGNRKAAGSYFRPKVETALRDWVDVPQTASALRAQAEQSEKVAVEQRFRLLGTSIRKGVRAGRQVGQSALAGLDGVAGVNGFAPDRLVLR